MITRRDRSQRVPPAVLRVSSDQVGDEIHVLVLREIVSGVNAPKVSGAMLDQESVKPSVGAAEKLERAMAMLIKLWRWYSSGAIPARSSIKSSSVKPLS